MLKRFPRRDCTTMPGFVRTTIRRVGSSEFSARDELITANISTDVRYSTLLISVLHRARDFCDRAKVPAREDRSRKVPTAGLADALSLPTAKTSYPLRVRTIEKYFEVPGEVSPSFIAAAPAIAVGVQLRRETRIPAANTISHTT